MIPAVDSRIQLHDLFFEPMLSAGQMGERVNAMGRELQALCGSDLPLFVGILTGGFVFLADLVRAFEAPCEIAFVHLSSYEGTQSTGTVQNLGSLKHPVAGRHVVVVEDIVDSGRTLNAFLHDLHRQKPASLRVAAMLRKPDAAVFPIHLDLLGFDIPDRFVVGYGMDYNGLGRNLPGVYAHVPDADMLG